MLYQPLESVLFMFMKNVNSCGWPCVTDMEYKTKLIQQIDRKVLLALRPNSGGQLVALSGLRLVSSEKEESISAWYLDKCWGWD